MPDDLQPLPEFGGTMTPPEKPDEKLPVVPAEPDEPSNGAGGGIFK